MNAVVVYESHWGNTKAVAHAIAEGIGSGTRVLSTAKAAAGAIEDVELLVVGAPVIGFRLSTEKALENMRATRKEESEPPDVSHPPVRSWLESLARGTAAVAAFDTRIRGPFGSAAPAILRTLEHSGYHPVAPPMSFTVRGSKGPLREGELERAREWGTRLANAVQRSAATTT